MRAAAAAAVSALKSTLRAFAEDRPMQLAAALSYYTLLSLAPLVLMTVSLTGLVFGREAVEGRIVEQMRGLVGEEGATVIQTVIQNASNPKAGGISLIIGIFVLLIGATSVFVELQDAMNRIWDVEAKPRKSAILAFLRHRLVSLGMVVGVGFLLLVSLIISAALSALTRWMTGPEIGTSIVAQTLDVLVSLGMVTVLFAMIFKFLPDVRLAWKDVWFGAAVTASLFTAGKFLIGLYLGRAGIGSAYGAAGSVVVLMVWVYYAALILFFGAEITYVRARREHKDVPLAPHAVPAGPRALHQEPGAQTARSEASSKTR